MPRLIGFFLGLLLALALAIVAMRHPQMLLSPGGSEAEAGEARATRATEPAFERRGGGALATLPRAEETPPAKVSIDREGDAVTAAVAGSKPVPAAGPAADTGTMPDTQTTGGPATPSAAVTDAGPPANGDGAPGDRTQDDPAAAPPSTGDGASDRQWFVFWLPFHSELSAEGFRTRLERVTGLDYRVQSAAPGEYQVAFAYRDEAERQQALAAIEAATGLALRSNAL